MKAKNGIQDKAVKIDCNKLDDSSPKGDPFVMIVGSSGV